MANVPENWKEAHSINPLKKKKNEAKYHAVTRGPSLLLTVLPDHSPTSRAGGEVGGVGWDTPTAGACSGLRGQALLVSSPSTTTGVQGGTPEWRRPWLRRQDHPAAEPAL